jgi:hypothetical protein
VQRDAVLVNTHSAYSDEKLRRLVEEGRYLHVDARARFRAVPTLATELC